MVGEQFTVEEFLSRHPGKMLSVSNRWPTVKDGVLWYELVPNPLNLWQRIFGHVAYISEDWSMVRIGRTIVDSCNVGA